MKVLLVTRWCLLSVLVAGCSRTPEPAGSAAAPTVTNAPSSAPAAKVEAPAAPGSSSENPPASENATMSWTAPKAWTSAPNPNTFRKATFKVPGEAGEAELSISESGGSLADNIARWEKQFGDAKAKTSKQTVSGLEVTLVELRGTYTNSMGMGNAGPQPNTVLLGAIVNTATPHFFKLTGPEKTVDAAKPQWNEFVKSFRPGA